MSTYDSGPGTESSTTTTVTSQSSFQVLYLATDYDPQYAQASGCKSGIACNNKILSTIHRAAVFYQNQLGYTLQVARQFGPTGHGTSTNAENLLDAFQSYNSANRLQYVHTGSNTTSNQSDLIQLFTGRTLDEDTIGIAYVETACRNEQSRFATLATQRVSDVLDPVTTAHEIGHTLSAQHTSSGIMRAQLGSSPPSTFASASLMSISNYLAQWYGECRQGVLSDDPPPTPTPSGGSGSSDSSNPFSGKPVTLDLRVTNSSPRALEVAATVSTVQAGCFVRLRVGISAAAALRGPAISERSPVDTRVSWSGSAAFRVNPGPSKNPFVYFVAEHACADGSTLEVSQIQKFNPNRVRGLRKTVRSKRAWIKDFITSIREAS
jgi:hypothetical protein